MRTKCAFLIIKHNITGIHEKKKAILELNTILKITYIIETRIKKNPANPGKGKNLISRIITLLYSNVQYSSKKPETK